MPAIRLPRGFPDQSTTTDVQGAAASFVTESSRADVFLGVRMKHPLSYRDLATSLEFFPPPTIFPASGTITVIIGETVTLTIEVTYSLTRY